MAASTPIVQIKARHRGSPTNTFNSLTDLPLRSTVTVSMPPYERSTHGCWSCRVRKKKCDEHFPACSNCTSRGITCHGYGPKPQWMDGGQREREVVRALRDEVKESLKQRKALWSAAKPPFSIPTPPSTTSPPYGSSTNAPPDLNYIYPQPAVELSPTSQNSGYRDSVPPDLVTSFLSGECTITDPRARRTDHESTLLMNYLDQVFPLQFRFYVPSVIELGRGWLLALLTRTKPLYHAALAMSAFYIKSALAKNEKDRSRCIQGHEEAMKTHHAIAFQHLQLQIAFLNSNQLEGTIKDRLEILACIIQLISFEVLVVNEIAADFLIGTILWYDIIATASTRSTAFLQNNVNYADNIELEKIMGCETWVMILIAQISALENWKRDMQKAGRLSVVELSSRGSEIAKLLNNGRSKTPAISKCPAQYSPLITQTFASSALTYLHVVVSGAYPELTEIKASVSMTLTALSNLPVPSLLQNLVWPFCVTGCMASRDHEPLLNDLVVAASEDAKCPGNYWKALEIIRECWRLREELTTDDGKGVDWVTSMERLGIQVLLV
ncbi:Pestheic acid cluster transcriptional regulator 3 [Hyphodiscus hymeniophilus]|uniref:Pestheic acid cluster transcriptional regulator 3 n=1 Tax=Hyphodiscus hymeniophilus TaxID=353542 RepID=A0A9P6VJN4_9HELO|nr:Pestheic acid cluster transcriptional regulator 3 [Hyphodiscus hymeniophilus]